MESFHRNDAREILKQTVETFRPEYLWFIGPEVPASLSIPAKRGRQTNITDLTSNRQN